MMAWDDKCRRCGLCCHEKILYEGELVIDLDAPCRFYDSQTNCCSVYKDRFVSCAECHKVTVLRAMFAAYLPESCGYVQWARSRHIRFARRMELRLIHSRHPAAADLPYLEYFL
ncbi:MAG: hypothetical protein LKE40_10615 [Spirochaetia bacterium]|jgi:uncharacterized cysteine cluster protein YcgN (CxxCxxCC family)|nr:hypothetical protein [Spirochaetia bacterium]